MSKLLSVNEEFVKEASEKWRDAFSKEYEKFLKNLMKGIVSEKADISIDIPGLSSSDEKAQVDFDPVCFLKMKHLIESQVGEVGWHLFGDSLGMVDGVHKYHFDDLSVYPQEVSSAYIDTDDKEFADWASALPDDKFNRMRGHIHSHVNMACNPSSVDERHRTDLLKGLGKEDFYVFMIWNKSGSWSAKIYDYKAGLVFDTADVTVTVGDNPYKWNEPVDAASKVKSRLEIMLAEFDTSGKQSAYVEAYIKAVCGMEAERIKQKKSYSYNTGNYGGNGYSGVYKPLTLGAGSAVHGGNYYRGGAGFLGDSYDYYDDDSSLLPVYGNNKKKGGKK